MTVEKLAAYAQVAGNVAGLVLVAGIAVVYLNRQWRMRGPSKRALMDADINGLRDLVYANKREIRDLKKDLQSKQDKAND